MPGGLNVIFALTRGPAGVLAWLRNTMVSSMLAVSVLADGKVKY